MCNAMFALKGQNAIIVAPHPRAQKTNKYVIDLFRAELKKLGLPEDLVQTVEQCSMDATTALMHGVDVVVATGGGAMVKSAYSSGKPALGVGPGNVQVIVDRGVDLEEAIPKIISGRIFDNGIICSGEQCVFLPEESFERVSISSRRTACSMLTTLKPLRSSRTLSSRKTVLSAERS